MLNLNDLYVFAKVVDHRGFAAASRALGLPKSTLSKRVAELERHLGARLIQRTSRSFAITETGRAFYRHAAAMLIEAEAAEQVVQGRLAEPSGVVRLTSSVTTAQLLLAEVLPELARQYPRMQVMLHATDRFVDLVHEGFDIAVRDHAAPLPDSDLVQRRVGFEAFHLVAAPAYLEQRGVPASPDDIAGHDGLLTALHATGGTDAVWKLTHDGGQEAQAAQEAQARPLARFFANEPNTLLRAATSGLGIACLPDSLCADAIAAGTLVRVLPAWVAGGMTTTLLVSHRRGQLPSVRAALEFLAQAIGGRRVV
jgi:DNA-binding transcriptional LysR family regulator